VREDATRAKARDLSQARAKALAGEFTSNFAGAAKSAGLTPATTELVARGTAWPQVGVSPAVDEAAFALPAGAVSAPIATDAGTVVVKVLEREEPAADQLASSRESLKQELLAERRAKFYNAYMAKARTRLAITINPDVVRQIVG
jgi:peptidyl-prolyl cis-trans isomerase D